MALTLKESEIVAFIRDPVYAAWHFFGVELDVHQRARLKLMWFVPEFQDDSGIFTGKTLVGWIWCQLRCMLLPSPRGYDPRIVAAFYQDMGSATTIFKPYYEKFIGESPRFRAELKRQQGGKLGYKPVGGGFEYVYKNGNSVLVPAIGLKEDAEKMASLRVHDGMVEEAKSVEKKSDALDNQLLSRINAKCWNPYHPVWTNHKVLMGHAEDPATHPAYKRHKAAKEAIRDGDQDVVVITSNFRDWTPPFVHLRKDKEIKMAKRTMSPAKFAHRYEGRWEYGTEDWYEAPVIKKCRSARAPVLTRRDQPEAVFTLGQDTAGGESRRSDWNAMVVWRGLMVPEWVKVPDTTGLYRAVNGTRWHISPVWAWKGRSRDAGQISGIVHRMHRRFNFARIVYDPGGGGQWAAKEYWKPDQFFDGHMQKVPGLCRPEDSGLYPQASPILLKWSKGSSDLVHAFEDPHYLNTDDGIVEGIHLKAQEMFYGQSFLFPLPPDETPKSMLALYDEEQRKAHTALDQMLAEFIRIKVAMITKDGEEVQRKNKTGFRSFLAIGKKDLAYAGLYGLAGLLSVINDPEFQSGETHGSDCMAVG